MPKQIQDEFTNLRISRQRRYQLRHEKKGLCRCCSQLAVRDEKGEPMGLCPEHQLIQSRTCANARKPGHDFI